MSPLGRAGLGALFGALLTLFLHPASRPFLTAATRRFPNERLERCIDLSEAHPEPPQDLKGASLWLQLACERLAARSELRPGEIATIVSIADRAASIDRQNAYWNQQKATFLSMAGRSAEALAAWQQAAKASFWNDYQTVRLQDARARIASLVGAPQAWQLAYVYYERSDAPALIIERYARTLLSQVGFETPDGVRTRYITLINGELMRTGCRSMSIGYHAANIVELAAYPANLVGTPSPKRLWLGQNAFLTRLLDLHMVDENAHARHSFSLNESWRALTQYQEPEEFAREQASASVISSNVIGAAAFSAVIGVLLWSIGMVAAKWCVDVKRFDLRTGAGIALLLAMISWSFTHDLAAGLVSALSGAFLLVSPKNIRRVQPEDLGPLFTLTMGALALTMGLVLGGYAISGSPAAVGLLPRLGVPYDYYGTPLLPGLASILFTLVVLAAPIWALVQRIATPHVFTLALRRVGVTMAVGSVVCGIVLGPFAVYADREIGQTLTQLVENEPLYYLLHP